MRPYLLALLCALTLNYHAEAQTLHAFLFCKTNDPNADMRNVQLMNFNNVDAFCAQLAGALGYQYMPHPLLGTSFNSKKAREMLATKTNGDDIVVLYYGSHGARRIEMTNFVPLVDIPPEWVKVYDEYQAMCDRHPRFVLTLVDACNGVAPLPPDSEQARQARYIHQSSPDSAPLPLAPLNVARMQQLFWNSNMRGLVITACKPGMEAVGIPSIGSVFTNCFIKAVNDFSRMDAPDPVAGGWSRLLQMCAQATHDESLGWLKSEDQAYSPRWDSLARLVLLSPVLMQVDVSNMMERQSVKLEKDSTGNFVTKTEKAADSTVASKREPQGARQLSVPKPLSGDTAIIRGYTLRAACKRYRSFPRLRQWYKVSLTVDEPATSSIDSVEYFLHYSMPHPRVMVPSAKKHFAYAFSVYDDYPVKARLYLRGGQKIDVYRESLLSTCRP